MMGTLVLARVAGSGEFSDDILTAGREAVLGRVATPHSGGRKAAAKKTGKAASARH
jgi:TetR/AcrR family transcriptional repressor of nem operon